MSKRYPFAIIKEKLLERQDDVVDFAIGRFRITLPETLQQWVRDNADLALVPGNRDDMRAFCNVAAAFLAREYGLAISADHILPTPGGRAAMTTLIASVLQPGDRVAVTVPGYPAFARLAAHGHAEVLEMSLDPARHFAPDVSVALSARHSSVRVISVNYPNNPTGATLSGDVSAALSSLCVRGAVVFNDATYGPLVYDGAPRSILAEPRLEQSDAELVELHSFSKLFPLGPVAASFLAGSDDLMRSIRTYSEFAWSPLSQLQLRATALAMQDAERSDELRAFFPPRIAELRDTLESMGFSPFATPSGVYVLCPVPEAIGGRPVDSAGAAAERLIDDFGLAVVPQESRQDGYLRFSLLYRDEDIVRLRALRGTLELS